MCVSKNKRAYHCSSKHRNSLHGIEVGATGPSKFVPDLTGNAALQIGQILSRTISVSTSKDILVVDESNIQDIARLPFSVGHHLYEVVSVCDDAEAVRRDDGMDRIVVGRHNVEWCCSVRTN